MVVPMRTTGVNTTDRRSRRPRFLQPSTDALMIGLTACGAIALCTLPASHTRGGSSVRREADLPFAATARVDQDQPSLPATSLQASRSAFGSSLRPHV